MPTLELVEHVFSLYSPKSFERVCIIGVQNILPSTLDMFRSFFKRGLKPKNVSLIGPSFTTSRQAFLDMQSIGINVTQSSFEFDSHVSFDEFFYQKISNFVRETIKNFVFSEFEKVIVMDAGGALLTCLTDLVFPIPKNVVGIEQTSSGYNKIKEKEFSFSILNVGRSEAKLIYESVIVAKLTVQNILYKIKKLDLQIHSVLIIGGGKIGLEIFNYLKQMNKFELRILKSSKNYNNFSPGLNQYDMIIGCTGSTSIYPSQFKELKKNAILVNSSWSDNEFSAWKLRKKVNRTSSCHEDIKVDGIYLLNSGFPINLDETAGDIDPPEFAITRALLSLGILQACSCDMEKSGFLDLDSGKQEEIIGKFLKMM